MVTLKDRDDPAKSPEKYLPRRHEDREGSVQNERKSQNDKRAKLCSREALLPIRVIVLKYRSKPMFETER